MATFIKATGRNIQDAFEEFHKNNPHVYELFKKEVFKAIRRKKKKISAKMVVNFLRWTVFMQTEEYTLFEDKNKVKHKFRINDAYHSRYARKFATDYPKFADIFNYKDLRS